MEEATIVNAVLDETELDEIYGGSGAETPQCVSTVCCVEN
jgi:hypothetical protein